MTDSISRAEDYSVGSPRNLYDLLRNSAERLPQKPAIHCLSRTITFSQMLDEVKRLACALAAIGVGHGDRVFISMPNCSAFNISYFAIFSLGAVAVPIPFHFRPREFAALISHCRPKAGIISQEASESVKSAVDSSPVKPSVILCSSDSTGGMQYSHLLRQPGSETTPAKEPGPQDTALVLYTSGTTGDPKGVVLTHDNVVSNVSSCEKAMPVTPDDRFILFLPTYHSFGFTVCVALPTYLGSTCVVLPGPKRELIAEACIRHQVTAFVGIPALYGMMARAEGRAAAAFDSVRFYISGAAPLSRQTLEAFPKLYEAPLLEGYGLTEAAPVVSLNPFEGKRKVGSVGIPLPQVQVRVVDEDGADLPTGQIGELLVRGANVTPGYFEDPAATKQRLREGWLYTGDMARIDEEGYIFIEDRKDDMILVQGVNVYPHEVEDAIRTISGVEEVAVVGLPDRHLGKRPVAAVKCSEGACLSERDVLDHLKDRLSNHKIPRQVLFFDELPLSPLGKPLKRKVREVLLSQSDR